MDAGGWGCSFFGLLGRLRCGVLLVGRLGLCDLCVEWRQPRCRCGLLLWTRCFVGRGLAGPMKMVVVRKREREALVAQRLVVPAAAAWAVAVGLAAAC